ncbi:MAG: replicative DNA helicase [Acidobacteriota bacterium]
MSVRASGGPRARVSAPEAVPPATLRIPSNPSAERAVLGAILADGTCFYRIVELVRPEDFYTPAHRVIFEAFAALAVASRDIDLLTAADQLQRSGTLEEAGGISYLASLTQDLPDTANVEHYAGIVRERAVKRDLLRLSQQIMAAAGRDEGDAMEALEMAEMGVLAISERATTSGPQPVGALAKAEVSYIQQVSRTAAPYTGLETGYQRLDELTSGLQKQELIILAARPGVGKTAFALNVAAHCALRKGAKVAIFSLEMSASALVRRLLAAEARIDLRRLARGLLSRASDSVGGSDWERLHTASQALATASMWIDDTAAISPLELRGKCRRLALEHGLDLVVVDYLQLMSAGLKAENRTQEVSAISRSLKALAKQLNVPLLVLSQLSRRPEQRGGDHTPQLSDLRESGSIEQDADVVVFINRRTIAGRGQEDDPATDTNMADIIVAKQRNGPTDTFRLVYLDKFTRFENLERSAM